MSVTAQEIVELLLTVRHGLDDTRANYDWCNGLLCRIQSEGIAPPNGWVLVSVQDPAVFTEWLCREMPAGTIIGDANWWAKRIMRRFIPQAAAPKPEVKP